MLQLYFSIVIMVLHFNLPTFAIDCGCVCAFSVPCCYGITCGCCVVSALSLSQFVGKIPDTDDTQPIVWVQLSTSCHVTGHMTEGMKWERLHFTTSDLPYEALLLLPPHLKATPPPLVVHPHGGPHIVTVADFLVLPVCLAALGYAVLMVNYRGSMGFGQDSIYSLPGNVGTQDVLDVQVHGMCVVSVVGMVMGDVCMCHMRTRLCVHMSACFTSTSLLVVPVG